MKAPTISIYITSFNYEEYLERSIESALKQSFDSKKYEILVIDDCSTDNSKKIISKYLKQNKIRAIFNKRNLGLTKSINIAIKASKGEYVIRLDADDMLNKNALKKFHSQVANDKSVGIVYSDYYLIDKFDNIIKREKKINLQKSKMKILDSAPHGACSLIKKEFLIENGMYDESIDRQDGYDLWYKFLNKNKIKNINFPLFYYRQHGNSLSKNTRRLLKTRSRIIEKHISKKNYDINFALIPVRGREFDESCLSVEKIKKKPIIFWSIEAALKAKSIKKIILSTGDIDLIRLVKKKFRNKIYYHLRDKKFLYENTSYLDMIPSVVEKTTKIKPKNVIVLNIECPFRESFYIDKAIYSQIYYKSDRTVAVQAENSGQFYKYGKNGLEIISNNKYDSLRAEKKYVFTECGGIEVLNFKKLKKKKSMETTSHILMDKKSGFVIRDDFDLKIAQKLDS